MKKRILFLSVLAIITSFCIFTFNKNKTEKPIQFSEEEGSFEERTADFNKAVKEEEDLLKDPQTGKIPPGIRELELAQARAILDQQLSSGDASKIAANAYTYQGPSNLGGRTRAITFDISDGTSNTILAGSVSGGVFKTTNGGTSWTRVSPNNQLFSVTTIAQDTRVGFRNIWYYAGGENLGNSAGETGALYLGDGIYKSIDNGNSWTRLGNSNLGSLYVFDDCNDYINRIIVNPANGDVYAAAGAQIIRSQDGGTNWSLVLGPGCSNNGQLTDIICNSAGNRFYAAFSGNTPGGTTDGVWTSTTGNSASWTHIAGSGSGSTPAGWNAFNAYGRVVLAIAPSNENLVFTLYYNNTTSACAGVPAPEAELYRWDQSGSSWIDLSATLPNEAGCSDGNDPFAVQGGYDLAVTVKPDDANTLFIGGTNVYRSTDGGGTWTRIGGYAGPSTFALYPNHHSDIHALRFGPASNNILFCGDDGGIQRADISGAVSWTVLNNDYRTYQYYHVAIKQEAGVNDFIGGAQDNGTTTSIGGGTSMSSILSGDGVAVGLASGAAPYTQFCGAQNGTIVRRQSNLPSGSINANLSPGLGSIFVTYFLLDPDNTENLYYACQPSGNNRILRITNATTSTVADWQQFTFNYSGQVRSMAVTRGAYSPTSRLYVGTSNGKLYRMTDPQNAALAVVPTDITPTGMTGGGTLIGISVNPTNHDEVLAVYSNYGTTNIWYTANAGVASPTWVNEEGNLSLPSIRSCLIVKNGASTEYYVGTSIGLYRTNVLNGGSTVWTQEAVSEIGNSLVTGFSLRTADKTFIIGTHGSGMWKSVVGNPLAVHFTSFTGTLVNNTVRLKWQTATEDNNKGFEVQRSYDGVNYIKIGFVNGAGNSSQLLTYQFNDNDVAQDLNYYRLKQIDFDNHFEYSTVVLVKNPYLVNKEFKILTNPFTDHIDVQLPKKQSGQLVVRLIATNGQVVYSNTMHSDLIRVRIPLGTATLSTGTYLLQLIAGEKQFAAFVVKL